MQNVSNSGDQPSRRAVSTSKEKRNFNRRALKEIYLNLRTMSYASPASVRSLMEMPSPEKRKLARRRFPVHADPLAAQVIARSSIEPQRNLSPLTKRANADMARMCGCIKCLRSQRGHSTPVLMQDRSFPECARITELCASALFGMAGTCLHTEPYLNQDCPGLERGVFRSPDEGSDASTTKTAVPADATGVDNPAHGVSNGQIVRSRQQFCRVCSSLRRPYPPSLARS
eukprot:6188352-Pleurochrysis_carterae.AAC.1